MKKWLKNSLIGLGVFFAILGTLMYVPFSLNLGYTSDQYAHVLKDANISGDTKIIDIAMLGAHDAFSHQIGLASPVDPAEDGIVANTTVNAVFRGGLVRVLKAQKGSARVLLNRGVRYFDVRVSYYEDSWYTKHGLISATLASYLSDVFTFLDDKPEEFVILDVQHIYLGDQTIADFLNYLLSLQLQSSGAMLEDFINYTADEISELEYFDVQGTTKGGIILLLNDDGTATNNHKKLFYSRDGENASIRSMWHNQTAVKDIIPLINEEVETVKNLESTPFLRVNQAQLTPDYMKEPLKTLYKWSLINLAARSNKLLLNNPDFDIWLEELPIFMVDFANSRQGKFNVEINKKMIAYNQKFTN